MKITSPAFEHKTGIPARFTCEGENISPPLKFEDIPEDARSMALIVEDPDIPKEVRQSSGLEAFDHWIVFNIPRAITEIEENSAPGTEGLNSAGDCKYTGPCPPPQFEPKEHRYFFRIYALDTRLDLKEKTDKHKLLSAMEGHILEIAELIGLYEKTGS